VAFSPVYSVPLIIYTEATPNESFDVPSGYTIVVREIDYYCALGGGSMAASIELAGSGAPCTFAALNVSGINASGQWTGRVPLTEGGTLAIDVTHLGTGDSIYVGGYLLQNTLT